jgi:hypothetical protein
MPSKDPSKLCLPALTLNVTEIRNANHKTVIWRFRNPAVPDGVREVSGASRVMQRKPAKTLIGELALHLAMGAGLGAALGLSLVLSNAAGISDMIRSDSEPATMLAIVIGVFTSIFAVGATLTGLIFTVFDGD